MKNNYRIALCYVVIIVALVPKSAVIKPDSSSVEYCCCISAIFLLVLLGILPGTSIKGCAIRDDAMVLKFNKQETCIELNKIIAFCLLPPRIGMVAGGRHPATRMSFFAGTIWLRIEDGRTIRIGSDKMSKSALKWLRDSVEEQSYHQISSQSSWRLWTFRVLILALCVKFAYLSELIFPRQLN